MKQINLKCPYCGSTAFLRPASVVFGRNAREPKAPFYVCARYPACNSYVAAHRGSRLPMGTLADPALRRKRVQAHAALDRLWQSGLMTRKQAYLWLQARLDLPEEEVHIGRFSSAWCDLVIDLCSQFHIPGRRAA